MACSIGLVLAAVFVTELKTPKIKTSLPVFLSEMADGLQLVRGTPGLMNLVILVAVALPVGQLSNAILSSFVHDHLGKGSDAFGLIDGAWPIGGMAAAILLSLPIAHALRQYPVYLFSILVALSTFIFSFIENIILLTLIHGLMGFLRLDLPYPDRRADIDLGGEQGGRTNKVLY